MILFSYKCPFSTGDISVSNQSCRHAYSGHIGHAENDQGLGTNIFSLRYKHLMSIELKNTSCHLQEHPKISKFTSFDGYWFKPKGMVHLVWIGEQAYSNPYYSLILKVYHAFVFKPITIKFGKFTNFWMLFQMTCPIFNSINTEYHYQEKICSYPVPCSFLTWPIVVCLHTHNYMAVFHKDWELPHS